VPPGFDSTRERLHRWRRNTGKDGILIREIDCLIPDWMSSENLKQTEETNPGGRGQTGGKRPEYLKYGLLGDLGGSGDVERPITLLLSKGGSPVVTLKRKDKR